MWHTSLRDFLTFFIITSWFSVMNFEFLSKSWAYDEIGSVHRCLSSLQKFYNENNNNKRCFAMVKAAELQLLLLGVRTNAADWSASHDKHVQFYGLSVKISVQSLFPVSASAALKFRRWVRTQTNKQSLTNSQSSGTMSFDVTFATQRARFLIIGLKVVGFCRIEKKRSTLPSIVFESEWEK